MKEKCIYEIIHENNRYRSLRFSHTCRPRPRIEEGVRIIYPPNTSPRRRWELYEQAMRPFRSAIDEIDDL